MVNLMAVQDHSTPVAPRPSILLSHLPDSDLSNLTRPVAGSFTRRLGSIERATVRIALGPVSFAQVDVDDDPLLRVASYFRRLVDKHGVYAFGGPSLARHLEDQYRPWHVRASHDADRGWQLLTQLDADWRTGITIHIAADPETADGDRREMRLYERVAELVVGR